MANEYGIRPDTMEAVKAAVGMLENAYINPYLTDDGTEPPITLPDAIAYCVEAYDEEIRATMGKEGKATRFSGKAKVLKAIESEILKSQYIILTK